MSHVFLLFGSKMGFPVYNYAPSDHSRPAVAQDIIGDLKLCRVTEINCVPRILDMIMEMFEEEVNGAIAKASTRSSLVELDCYTAVRQRYRDGLVFGPQLDSISWGSAPIQSKTKDWVFNVWGGCDNFSLAEGYGSSEGGTITVDERVTSMVVCFVVDASEYGFSLENGQGQVVVYSLEVGFFRDANQRQLHVILWLRVHVLSCVFMYLIGCQRI
jgi:long-subunit acyl-CoA synthetase (AMP-forming)